MLKKLTLAVVFLLITVSVSNVVGYTYTGTIRENGDSYWDENEIVFIEFELDEGETLDISLSSSGSLELMLCDCSDVEDIENIFEDLISYFDSSDLYLWLDSYDYTSGSYTASERIDVTVAIFTIDPTNPSSMSYTLETNLPKGDRIQDFGFLYAIIIIGVIIGGIYWYNNRNKKSGLNTYQSQNYNTGFPKYQQGQAPYQTTQNFGSEQAKSSQALFCPNCGSQVQSVFCTECGTKVN